MNKLKERFVLPVVVATATGIALISAGCTPGASLVLNGVAETMRAATNSAMAKPDVFVKAKEYPGDAFESDSICVHTRVRGGVHVKVKDALRQRVHAGVVESLRAKGFAVVDSGCDVDLDLAYTMKQMRPQDEPKVQKIKGVARKGGQKVYAMRSVNVFYEPLDEIAINAPAEMLDRLRALYGPRQADVSQFHGFAFWKSDSYSWDQLEDDTVCTSVKANVKGDLGPYKARFDREMYYMDLGLRNEVNRNLSDADTEDCDTDMVMTVDVDEPSGPPEDYYLSTRRMVVRVTANGVPVYSASARLDKPILAQVFAASDMVNYLAKCLDLAKELD